MIYTVDQAGASLWSIKNTPVIFGRTQEPGHIKLKLTKEYLGNAGPHSSMLKSFPHPRCQFFELKK